MATLASLIIDVSANTVKLTKDVEGIQGSLDKVGNIASKLGGVIAGAFSIQAVTNAASKFIEFTGSLTDMAAKTGISTTELQKLKFAAEQNGGTLEGVTGGIVKMGKALVEGNSGTVAAVSRLGLSLTDLRKMEPAEAFATLSDAIAKVPNPLERSKLAMDLFGKSGADLLPMMTGHMKETMEAAAKLGLVIDEQTVAAGDNLGDSLTALQGVGMGVVGKLLGPMLPALQMVADGMMGAGHVVDYLRDMFDALTRVGLMAIKWLVDGAIRVGELAKKVPGLSKVLGDDATAMQGLKDASTFLGGAIAGLEKGTDTSTIAVKKAVQPIVAMTKAQEDSAKAIEAIRAAQIPLTDAQKSAAVANDKLGISAETTGKALKVSAAAVSTYLDSIKNGKEIEEIWRKFHESAGDTSKKFIDKWIDDTTKGQRVIGEASLKAIATQYLVSKEYQELNYQLTLRGTDLVIHQIELERDAKIRALGDAGGEIRKYYQHEIDLANGTAGTIEERMGKHGVYTKGVLQGIADAAMRDYMQMAEHSERWGDAAVEDQKKVAEAAQRAADGTSKIWRQTYDALGKVGDVLDIIPGKMAKIGSEAVSAARHVMDRLADGDVWGAVVAAAAGAVKVITGIWTAFFGTAGRDIVKEFAASMGGFDTLHAKLLTLGAAGEQLWIKLTQGVGRNNPEQAKKVIEEINAALAGQDAWMGRLPDLIEKYGLSWEQAGIKAKQAHLDEIAAGLIQDFADLSRAGFDVTTITEHMGDAINQYVQDAMKTGTEIPAAMKPLLQKMIEMGTLTDAAGVAITDLGQLTFSESLTEGFKSIVEAIHELMRALGALPSAIHLPDVTGGDHGGGDDGDPGSSRSFAGMRGVLPFATRGVVKPIGVDALPGMASRGNRAVTAAQQRNVAMSAGGSTSISITVNGSDDPDRVADKVIEKLRREMRLNAA